jgi:hypothetical protein
MVGLRKHRLSNRSIKLFSLTPLLEENKVKIQKLLFLGESCVTPKIPEDFKILKLLGLEG